MKDKVEKDFLTAEEISKYFMIPINTIYRLSRNGKIKGIKVGKQWRYTRTEIEELVSNAISPRSLPAKKNSDYVEKRVYPRLNCNISCIYSVNIPSNKEFKSDTGCIRNISAGGVCLSDKPHKLSQISVGDPMELNFELPTGYSIKTDGRVVRSVEGGVVILDVGVKFRHIDRDYQNEIIHYVD